MRNEGKTHPCILVIIAFIILAILAVGARVLDELFLRISLYGLFSFEVCFFLFFLPLTLVIGAFGLLLILSIILAAISILGKSFR